MGWVWAKIEGVCAKIEGVWAKIEGGLSKERGGLSKDGLTLRVTSVRQDGQDGQVDRPCGCQHSGLLQEEQARWPEESDTTVSYTSTLNTVTCQ